MLVQMPHQMQMMHQQHGAVGAGARCTRNPRPNTIRYMAPLSACNPPSEGTPLNPSESSGTLRRPPAVRDGHVIDVGAWQVT